MSEYRATVDAWTPLLVLAALCAFLLALELLDRIDERWQGFGRPRPLAFFRMWRDERRRARAREQERRLRSAIR